MNPALFAIIAELALKYGPAFAQALVEIFHAKEPTLEQWKAAFALSKKNYEDYVKEPVK